MAGIGSSARWRAGNDGIRESEGTIIINGGNIRAKGQDNASAIGGTRAEEIEFRSTDRGEVYNRRQGGSITINGGVVRTEPFALPEGNPLAVDSVGIGTCQMGYGGSVTINGGTVIAEAANDAITTGDGGTITINGGDVTARGGVNNFGENSHRVLSGNGIGPYESGSVIINGGTVKATAKGNGFGIGGARIYNTGAMTVTINEGTIEATANRNNAAIGDKGKGESGVTINGGVIHAVGKGGAAGIGSKGDIRIIGGELTVSAEGSGAAIGGFTDSYSERVNCKSITINGNAIQSISSTDGACIGGAAGGSIGSITISDAALPLLSAEKILIGWDADSPGGKLTIRNCHVESTDELTTRTDGIRVGSNKKIRAVMKVKGNAGEHLTTLPPYGYMKSPDNKKLWVRDEEAAAVVYEIGLYVMDGFGPSQIARKLTERRILTPAAYYASRGRKASNIKRGLPYAWDASTVADIMDRWREYLGHTVNFKTRKKSYKSKKVIHNPESEWMIFENTHDPIWTEAIADAARAARQTRRRPTKMGEMGMFSGMMFCADCGSVMYQCRATNFRREQEYYLCAGYRKSRDFCGQTHSIRTVILEELILENLREIVSFASRSKDEFVRLVMDSDLRQRDRDLAKRKRQLADSEKRITELDAIFKRLYEDNISGKLSDERFQKLSADYEKEEQDLKVLTSSLRKEVELEESKSADVDRFLSVVERYTDIPELTPCILHEFVEKIIVHAASDPKGKNRTQEIDIYYKGIGALEMSKVTASMEK